MDFYRHLFTKSDQVSPITFTLVYLISVIFTFQTLVTAYSSSTYMEQFVAPEFVGTLYSIAAGISILLSLTLPRLLRRIGNVLCILLLILSITIAFIFMGLALNAPLTIVAFIVYLALAPQVYFNIDIFLETITGTNESTTGSKRGLILTLASLAAFASPLVMGYIIGTEDKLENVYYVGAVVGVLLIALIISKFRHFFDTDYQTIKVRDMIRATAKNVSVRTVLVAQFLLQFFFTWAIIYMPLYLATEVGLAWPIISQILAAGLLAFVIFEYPIGLVADRHWGEKEMMAVGFVILALASASMSAMLSVGVLGWMLLMFFSRIGASLVEVTTESYFFKQVKADEANLISLFRLMRPLGNLTGALVGSLALFFLPFNFIFLVLAFIMVSGVFITLFLNDTK